MLDSIAGCAEFDNRATRAAPRTETSANSGRGSAGCRARRIGPDPPSAAGRRRRRQGRPRAASPRSPRNQLVDFLGRRVGNCLPSASAPRTPPRRTRGRRAVNSLSRPARARLGRRAASSGPAACRPRTRRGEAFGADQLAEQPQRIVCHRRDAQHRRGTSTRGLDQEAGEAPRASARVAANRVDLLRRRGQALCQRGRRLREPHARSHRECASAGFPGARSGIRAADPRGGASRSGSMPPRGSSSCHSRPAAVRSTLARPKDHHGPWRRGLAVRFLRPVFSPSSADALGCPCSEASADHRLRPTTPTSERTRGSLSRHSPDSRAEGAGLDQSEIDPGARAAIPSP